MHGQELCNAWIRKVPDATVIDEVEAFAKDWGWQIDERADADQSCPFVTVEPFRSVGITFRSGPG